MSEGHEPPSGKPAPTASPIKIEEPVWATLAAPQIRIGRAAHPASDRRIDADGRAVRGVHELLRRARGSAPSGHDRGRALGPGRVAAITMFERGLARLVMHEIDHLNGMLYRDRMRPDVDPIPVSEYRGTGRSWRY